MTTDQGTKKSTGIATDLKDRKDSEIIGNAADRKIKTRSTKKRRNVQPYLKSTDEIFLENSSGLLHYLKASHIICIEFGPNEIRLMHFSKIEKKYQVEGWKEIAIQKQVLDNPDIILNTVGRFINASRRKKPKIVLILHGPEVIVKTIKLPILKEKQLKEAVFWKLKQEIPSFSENDLWDYHAIGEIEEGGKKWLSILSIIAQEKFVNKYLNILNTIRIYPKKVIVKPVAFTYALKNLTYNRIFKNKTMLLVEIGYESSLLCFFRNGSLEFVRNLSIGSNNIDKELLKPWDFKSRKITIKPEKLDLFKRKYGIINGALKQNQKGVFPYTKLFKIMLPVLETFVSELMRSISFYKNNFLDTDIQVAFITGNGANLKNLNSFLIQQLGFPVYSIGPFFPSSIAGEYFQGKEFTACFGAACHEGKLFNLVPKIIRLAKKYKYWQKVAIGIFILIFSSLTFYSNYQVNDIKFYKAENKIRKIESQKISEIEKKHKQLIQQKKELNLKKFLLLTSLRSQSSIVDNFRIISTLIPDDIVLSSFDYKDSSSTKLYEMKSENEGILILKGMVYKDFSSADISLIQFITKLQDLSYFKKIELTDKVKDENKQILSFKLSIYLP